MHIHPNTSHDTLNQVSNFFCRLSFCSPVYFSTTPPPPFLFFDSGHIDRWVPDGNPYKTSWFPPLPIHSCVFSTNFRIGWPSIKRSDGYPSHCPIHSSSMQNWFPPHRLQPLVYSCVVLTPHCNHMHTLKTPVPGNSPPFPTTITYKNTTPISFSANRFFKK